jgi:hypothetical protein
MGIILQSFATSSTNWAIRFRNRLLCQTR